MVIRQQPLAARRTLTALLLNLAAIVERADESILPAVYFFIGRSLNATLPQLGTLVLCRALVQALSSPLSGVLGDRYDRTHIVAGGCLVWGVMTAAIGASSSLGQAMVACGVNGLGLALVIPCVQSLIADYYPPDSRGRAFGAMGFTASVGGMVGAFYATNVGSMQPLGVEGWRFAFHLVAAVSLLTSYLVYRYAADPRHPRTPLPPPGEGQPLVGGKEAAQAGGKLPGSSPADLLRGSRVWADVRHVMGIRSFQIVVAQGIVGSIPWQAMAMFTVWLQLLGFTDLQSSTLIAVFSTGCAVGGLLGGTLGDMMARRMPSSGRILTCQLSVITGLPLSLLLLRGLPTGEDGVGGGVGQYAPLYGAVLLVTGLCISWCGCNNSAIFADLVPEELRSTIYAFDRSFEGAVAACGAPLVGVVAERWFGFRGAVGVSPEDAPSNAAALARSLLLCLVVPWVLCLLSYTALHWSFPRDRKRGAAGGDAAPLLAADVDAEHGGAVLPDGTLLRKLHRKGGGGA